MLITPAFASRNRQPFNLATGYLFKLEFPTFSGLGDEKQNQTVPRFAEPVVSYTFDTTTVSKARIG
jgi:hypothetical protein